METVYHLRIKKEYAAAVIEDLEKMEAVELFQTVPEDYEIPEWQKAQVRDALEEYHRDPSKGVSWEDALKQLNAANDAEDI